MKPAGDEVLHYALCTTTARPPDGILEATLGHHLDLFKYTTGVRSASFHRAFSAGSLRRSDRVATGDGMHQSLFGTDRKR